MTGASPSSSIGRQSASPPSRRIWLRSPSPRAPARSSPGSRASAAILPRRSACRSWQVTAGSTSNAWSRCGRISCSPGEAAIRRCRSTVWSASVSGSSSPRRAPSPIFLASFAWSVRWPAARSSLKDAHGNLKMKSRICASATPRSVASRCFWRSGTRPCSP